MRPNYDRARGAIRAFQVTIAVTAIMLVVKISFAMSFIGIINLGPASLHTFRVADAFVTNMNYGAIIMCAIVFIKWFRRAYFYIHQLLPQIGFRYSEEWALWSWFIPIFNLFGPYQITTDLIVHTEAYLLDKGIMNHRSNLRVIAGWWWGLWVTRSVLVSFTRRMHTSVDLATLASVLEVIICISAIGAAYFAIQMIKRYSEMEERLEYAFEMYDESNQDHYSGYDGASEEDLLDSGI